MMGKDIIIPSVINPIIRAQLNKLHKKFKKAAKFDTEKRCYYCHEWGEVTQMRAEYQINRGQKYIHFACHFKKFSKKI